MDKKLYHGKDQWKNRYGNLAGLVSGRLTVVEFAYVSKHERYWKCKCECGNYTFAKTEYLKAKRVKSCGCLKADQMRELNRKYSQTHKLSGSPEHKCWASIKDRCYREKNKAYKNYGAQGIVMCVRWLKKFENFYEDMGPRPSKDHSLDRICCLGNYEKSNCRWATRREQCNNRKIHWLKKDKQISLFNVKETQKLTKLRKNKKL